MITRKFNLIYHRVATFYQKNELGRELLKNFYISILIFVHISLLISCGQSDDVLSVIVYVPNTVEDGAANESFVVAMQKIESEIGSDGFSVTYQENVLPEQLAANIAALETEYDLIVLHHPLFRSSLSTLANANIEQSFAIWSDISPTDNVFVYDVKSAEPGFVNGRLAASLSENQQLAIITVEQSADLQLYAEGFELGAKNFNPDIQLNVVQAEISTIDQIVSEQISLGVDGFSGNGHGIVESITENDLFWFGNYVDQRNISETQVVVSQVYDWTVAFDEFFYFMEEENKVGGESYVLTMENSGILMRYNTPYGNSVVRQFGDEGLFNVINGQVDLP